MAMKVVVQLNIHLVGLQYNWSHRLANVLDISNV